MLFIKVLYFSVSMRRESIYRGKKFSPSQRFVILLILNIVLQSFTQRTENPLFLFI